MKHLVLIILSGLLFANNVYAAKAKKVSQKKQQQGQTAKSQAKSRVGARLQTDVRFDSSVVHGRYQTPEEAIARVENEKVLSDLLAVRKHFKDRLLTASEQE
jgi:hypothetical protein